MLDNTGILDLLSAIFFVCGYFVQKVGGNVYHSFLCRLMKKSQKRKKWTYCIFDLHGRMGIERGEKVSPSSPLLENGRVLTKCFLNFISKTGIYTNYESLSKKIIINSFMNFFFADSSAHVKD